MLRTFVETFQFTTNWEKLGLSDDDLRGLENLLMAYPKIGSVIPGTGGIRKVRIPYQSHGKRGGGRVVYVDIEVKEKTYLLDVYSKDEKTDLTSDEKRIISAVVKLLKGENANGQ